MEQKTIGNNMAKILESGMTDAVIDGVLVRDIPARAVLVTAESDLANLPSYPAGTLAYTAGFAAMWQLSAAGTWVEM